jgi:NAD(P) transhydrogenase subunit alpha
MRVAVPREIAPGERRVALVPEMVARLSEMGFEIRVEAGAGVAAGFTDEAYREAGAAVITETAALFASADVVLKVQRPLQNPALGSHEADLLPEGGTLISLFHPLTDPELVRHIAARRVNLFSMDLVPRITRAQKMDALSSQSTAAGYRAAIIAAERLTRFFPMLMTAAGTVPPARVLVLGAGVAGLQAIATARRLGAVVQAFDIRPAAREQVESLGATFVGLELEAAEDAGGYAKEVSDDVHRREQELLLRLIRDADAVITTALIPGRPAPVLITAEMVAAMRPGSVLVDLAAEAGGNCELTRAGEEVVHQGVTVVGLADAASAVAHHASQMYSRNISSLLLHLVQENELRLDLEDEITRACCVTRAGEVLHEGVGVLLAR